MSPQERRVERSLTIAAPRARVFKALLDPGAMSRWLFASVSMTPQTGSAFSVEWRDSAVPASATGEILELIPDQKLVLSWYMEADDATSTASFELDDVAGGTRLTFVHSGLPEEREWEPRFRAVALEWDKVLLNLRFLLEEEGEGKHLFYFRSQRFFEAPAHRVFRAWTTTAGLSAWMARDAFLVDEEGGEITGVTLDTGRALEARFLRIESDRHLRLTWSEGGKRGLLGVSFWVRPDGVEMTMTLRSFALMEGERPIVTALWDKRFRRLADYLSRAPLTRKAAGTGVFTLEREIEATPGRVWNALTDAYLLRRWFTGWTDFEARSQAPFVFLWDNYGEICGRVEEAHPSETLRYSWDIPELGETTKVTIRLLPEPNQPGLCRVRLAHEGWGSGAEWDLQRRLHEEGWASVLTTLEFFLQSGAGREKREVHLRRRVPLSLEQTMTKLNSQEGLRSWLADSAILEPREGGRFEFTLPGGAPHIGRVRHLHPSGSGAAVFTSPQPVFLEWGVAPDEQGSRVGFTLMAYGTTEAWLAERRQEWNEALDRLSRA